MTTYPLALPTITGPAKLTITGISTVGDTTAPFSGSQQIQEFQGNRWEGIIVFPNMRGEPADIWLAWLYSLRGKVGTFLLGDPLRPTSKGSAATAPGVPQVDGDFQTGFTLAIKTGLGNVTNYLRRNDRFSLGEGATRRLHRVTSDVNLVAGKATLEIWPRLRSVPLNNDAVVVAGATGLFRLTSNKVDYDEDTDGTITIAPQAIREAF